MARLALRAQSRQEITRLRALVLAVALVWIAGCARTAVVVLPTLPLSLPLPPPLEGGSRDVDLGDLIFDFSQPTLRGGAKDVLETVAQVLKGDPARAVLVEGHADDLATAEEHQALGLKRAEAVQAYLVGLGVEASRIKVLSHGDQRRLCRQQNESCRQQNRRAHLFLVTPSEAP